MLALRRGRLPSSSSRIFSVAGISRRTNVTTTTTTGSSASSASASVPPPVPPKKNESLLKPKPATLQKPATKGAAKQEGSKGKEGQGTASASATATNSTAAPQKAKKRGRRRRPFIVRQRPRISTSNPRAWNPPLQEGAVPAYDEALKVIYKDSRLLKKEVKEWKQEVDKKAKEVNAATGEEKETLDAELEKMRERLNILEVQSEINLPSVRWAVANAMADMRVPSHRYLVEQRWRKDGKLDLLMERTHQMSVVPDVLPVIHPSVDLDVTVKPPLNRAFLSPRRVFLVEPGKFLTPQQTIRPPTLFPHVFHTDTRLYTMLMVDPDVPDEQNRTFTTYLHWLKPNIPLSATHRGPIPGLNTHTTYIPPHPQRGSPYHRYTILLLPQPPKTSYSLNAEANAGRGVPTSEKLDIPVVPNKERLGFDVREFAKKWRLNAALGGGYHMFREVWDDTVTGIYDGILNRPEPHYARPRKEDPYAAFKTLKKYV
ncbi:mitochondrial 54S ribosomal protein YmL35 [Marasmius crinis-equi]|uniref:Mitochondrial 54S ribosomal protein YmL35 n=1 Tax=Marasmius crinis-equi TaxID=585013 RepID=A0ABR3EZI9_9AGAR